MELWWRTILANTMWEFECIVKYWWDRTLWSNVLHLVTQRNKKKRTIKSSRLFWCTIHVFYPLWKDTPHFPRAIILVVCSKFALWWTTWRQPNPNVDAAKNQQPRLESNDILSVCAICIRQRSWFSQYSVGHHRHVLVMMIIMLGCSTGLSDFTSIFWCDNMLIIKLL